MIWSNPGFSSKAIVDGIVYGYLYKEEKVQAIEIATGNIIWESATGGEVIGADRDYVYVSPATQRLDALSIKDGETKWRALLPSRPGKILVSQPNFIMVGGLLSNDLFKIDKNDGNILTELTDQNQTPLKENILLVGFSGVDITTGKVVWDLTNIHPNAIKICGDEVIYNRLDNGEQPSIVVEAIDITTADLLWRTDFPNDKVPNDIVP